MQNLNPTRVVARRGRDTMIIGALLLMSSIAAGGVGILLLLLFGGILGYLVIGLGLLLFIIGVAMMIRGLTFKIENPPALEVAKVLEGELDNRYTFIRNVSRQGLGYVDAILVGPPGALVFLIEDKPGIFLNEGADWLERKGGGPFVLTRLSATRDCVNDVYALRKYLAKRGLPQMPVYAVVVFVNPNVQLSARQPAVPIAELRTMMPVLRTDFMREERVDPKMVEATVNAIYQ